MHNPSAKTLCLKSAIHLLISKRAPLKRPFDCLVCVWNVHRIFIEFVHLFPALPDETSHRSHHPSSPDSHTSRGLLLFVYLKFTHIYFDVTNLFGVARLLYNDCSQFGSKNFNFRIDFQSKRLFFSWGLKATVYLFTCTDNVCL